MTLSSSGVRTRGRGDGKRGPRGDKAETIDDGFVSSKTLCKPPKP